MFINSDEKLEDSVAKTASKTKIRELDLR